MNQRPIVARLPQSRAAPRPAWRAVNLFHCEATKLRPARGEASAAAQSSEWSNQMRKMMSFAFGVLVGTIVATAWAHFPNYPTVDSPRAQSIQQSAQGSMSPLDMMKNTDALPVQHYDAF
jgi:hypothetical protein